MSFYHTFVDLCESHGVSPTQAAIDAGLSRSAPTKWKQCPWIEPSGDTLRRVSKYFGVSIGYLTGTELDKLDLDGFPDVRLIARAGRKLSPEQRDNLLRYMRFMFPEAFEDET